MNALSYELTEPLLPALSRLESQAGQAGCYDLQQDVQSLRSTYEALLRCVEQGASDPYRDAAVSRIKLRLYQLAALLRREMDAAALRGPYASTLHSLRKRGLADVLPPSPERSATSLPPTHCSQQAARAASTGASDLFDRLWTTALWTTAAADWFAQTLAAHALPLHLRAQMVSALTLSALSVPDGRKLTSLAHVCLSSTLPTDFLLRVRALVGLLLISIVHPMYCRLDHESRSALSQLADDETLRPLLAGSCGQMFVALETERTAREVTEEIMPSILESAQHIQQEIERRRQQSHSEPQDDDQALLGINPEWGMTLRESDEMMNKMKRLTDMQQQGADIYMHTFSRLRRAFPFFHEAAGWLCPFSGKHDLVISRLGEMSNSEKGQAEHILKFISLSPMCDSDRYALFLMLIGGAHVRHGGNLARLCNAEADETLRLIQDDMDESAKKAQIVRSYVQDLYRFFKEFWQSDGIHLDPFSLLATDEQASCLVETPLLSHLSDADIEMLADTAMQHSQWHLAGSMLQKLPSSAGREQKLGYIDACRGRLQSAAEHYERAALLHDESPWLLRQREALYRKLRCYDKALPLLERLLSARCGESDHTAAPLPPEQAAPLLLHKAECLSELGCRSEALAALAEADYLHPGHPPTMRALAWFSLLEGKTEQASRYYAKLLAKTTPSPSDCLNAGHTALVGAVSGTASSKSLAPTIAYYRRALTLLGSDTQKFSQMISDDEPILRQLGVARADLEIAADLARLSPV